MKCSCSLENIVEMASSRPNSILISPGVFDETNVSTRKSTSMHGHSSSSSFDSTNGNHVNFTEQSSSPPNLLTTPSSTTTDSDFESEQDDNQPLQQQRNGSNTSDQLSGRVKQFHKLFKSEIPDDMPTLIDSYVCAYQGDILLQGKMYITDRYLCFHSRIINYVTKHVYRWEQIESVSKERVAFIFPTAIAIQLKKTGKKIIYASFLQRDQAYEKICSIWSKSTNNIQSCGDDDDENGFTHDGTLKATNHNGTKKYSKRESYDVIDEPEQEVLQMCLKPNPRRAHSVPKKSTDEKRQSTKSEKKISNKNLNLEEKSSNESTNPTTRHSRYTKNEQKSNDVSKRNSSVVKQRPKSRNRTDETLSPSNSTATVIPNVEPPITNSNQNGILNMIKSFLHQINQYLSSLFPSYPLKTMIIILLILTILFFHSFYLIKLAFRIENRLQSLHHQWPSASSKNSFSSNTKEF